MAVSYSLAFYGFAQFLTRRGLSPFSWYRLALAALLAGLIFRGVIVDFGGGERPVRLKAPQAKASPHPSLARSPRDASPTRHSTAQAAPCRNVFWPNSISLRRLIPSNFGERTAGAFRQLSVALDAEHALRDPAHYRRRVPAPRADLQHPVVRLDPRRRDHLRHHVRLRDRLPPPERQRPVRVSLTPQALRHKRLARDRAHGSQHPFIGNPTIPNLTVDHGTSRFGRAPHKCILDVSQPGIVLLQELRSRCSPTTATSVGRHAE